MFQKYSTKFLKFNKHSAVKALRGGQKIAFTNTFTTVILEVAGANSLMLGAVLNRDH